LSFFHLLLLFDRFHQMVSKINQPPPENTIEKFLTTPFPSPASRLERSGNPDLSGNQTGLKSLDASVFSMKP
jgi:hypothetical protein